MKNSVILFSLIILICSCSKEKNKVGSKEFFTIESEGIKLKVEVVTDSITMPFGMDFLPDGRLLVTDRYVGNIVVVNTETGKREFVQDVPPVVGQGDCGMLDILVHPDYTHNKWIYFAYTAGDTNSNTMVVERGKLDGLKLVQRERLFTALPYYKKPLHEGTRLVLKDGYLFIGMGERTDLRDSAQTLSNHLGKILRIFEDGRVPEDNPYVSTPKAKPEIWSYGHRNPNGLTTNPFTGDLWEHEHGPKGGDEINIIKPGLNYGWPLISYGVNYDDTPVNEGRSEMEGMEQPIYYYKPSIAPSGMQFYTSDVIPGWKGNLFIGSMILTHLNRLVIKDNKVISEERLMADKKWRVRSVKQGPDGYLYLGVDGGKILRIMPD
ncbi:MAG TPA: PQQ-dependent sugar dehydrogenase [Cyclobacteriaceae bacterium]|nr:PQQ-dependent sugar dehydrogenase [Cyclobacteriaceae bacterium]